MKSYGILAIAYLLACATSGCDDSTAAYQVIDKEVIVGSWKPVNSWSGGKEMRKAFLNDITLHIAADGLYRVEMGSKGQSGHLELDQAKTPKHMTMRPHTGEDQIVRAVYELEADTLRVCYKPRAEFYPYKLESPPDSELILVEYMRVKSE